MGPSSTQIIGDLGADVIAVEPLEGTNSRRMGPGPHPELSGIALNLLRNKRSVAIDLKRPEGRDALLRIAATCDVTITNVRSASLRRLRLTYDDVRAVRPDIVYCQAVGYRSGSEHADDAAFDDVIQAASGVADAQRRSFGRPTFAATVMADKVCAMAIVNSVLAALLHRSRTGAGQMIEVPMRDVMAAFMLLEHGAGAIAVDGSPGAGYGRVLAPSRRPFRTADGWVAILPYSSADFDRLYAEGGRVDLVGDERTRGMNHVDHADFLYTQLEDIVATRTTAEWLAFCRTHDIAASPIVTLDELVAEMPVAEHAVAGAYHVVSSGITFSGSALAEPTDAPLIGQHTAAVLTEAGLSDGEIADLVAGGVVR